MQSNTPSETSPPIYSRIDERLFPALIEKVRGVLTEVSSHKALVIDTDFWTWQYLDLPSKTSRVYAALVNDEIMGYYHVPIYEGLIGGEKKSLAVVQEVAVDKRVRKQGVFRKLADFATEDLLQSGIAAVYTFPNDRSIHTFLKYNAYTLVGTLGTYILPVRSGDILRSKINLLGVDKAIGLCADFLFRRFSVRLDREVSIQVHSEINPDIVRVFSAYQEVQRLALLRDESYLRWRFDRRPSSPHYYFSIDNNQNQKLAVAIFKLDEMFDNPVLLLMDYAHLHGKENYLLQLIQHVKLHGAEEIGARFNLIVTSGNSEFLPLLKRVGFIRLPERLNSRPLKLVVKNLSQHSTDAFDPRNWHLTLSDWDVL